MNRENLVGSGDGSDEREANQHLGLQTPRTTDILLPVPSDDFWGFGNFNTLGVSTVPVRRLERELDEVAGVTPGEGRMGMNTPDTGITTAPRVGLEGEPAGRISMTPEELQRYVDQAVTRALRQAGVPEPQGNHGTEEVSTVLTLFQGGDQNRRGHTGTQGNNRAGAGLFEPTCRQGRAEGTQGNTGASRLEFTPVGIQGRAEVFPYNLAHTAQFAQPEAPRAEQGDPTQETLRQAEQADMVRTEALRRDDQVNPVVVAPEYRQTDLRQGYVAPIHPLERTEGRGARHRNEEQ